MCMCEPSGQAPPGVWSGRRGKEGDRGRRPAPRDAPPLLARSGRPRRTWTRRGRRWRRPSTSLSWPPQTQPLPPRAEAPPLLQGAAASARRSKAAGGRGGLWRGASAAAPPPPLSPPPLLPPPATLTTKSPPTQQLQGACPPLRMLPLLPLLPLLAMLLPRLAPKGGKRATRRTRSQPARRRRPRRPSQPQVGRRVVGHCKRVGGSSLHASTPPPPSLASLTAAPAPLPESADAAERAIPRYSRLLTEPEVPAWVRVDSAHAERLMAAKTSAS